MAFAAIAAPLLLSACNREEDAAPAPQRPAGAAYEAAHVVAAINRLPEFSQFMLMLESTGLQRELESAPALTLLAVRDTALAELPTGTVQAMLAPANANVLRGQLRALALPRLLTAGELRTEIDAAGGMLSLQTLGGVPLSFSRDGEMLIVTAPDGSRASMGSAEIGAANGAVYVLDGWLGPAPAPLAPTPQAPAQ